MIQTPDPQSIQERVGTKMVNSDLPQEILLDIFSRLPAKSAGRCRCLAKSWRALLSSPRFIKSHLTRKPDQQSLLLITPSPHILSIATVKDHATSTTLDALGDNNIEVAGSCDGLVLLVNSEREKLLVNPTTLQQVNIPDSPLALEKGESFSMFGFGYDRSSDDYKVVALSFYELDLDTFVDVYSVKRGVWKRVENSPNYHIIPHFGAFVNGAIHWLASSRESDYPYLIVAFSLADEVFDEIPAPIRDDANGFVLCGVAVVGGCLCAVYNSYTHIDIWIMKEYGRADSWMRLTENGYSDWSTAKPLCYIGDEEEVVVLHARYSRLVVYNRKEGRSRNMIVDGVSKTIEDAATFIPTLVSPEATLMEI